MEALSFAFGMLTMVGVVFAALIVVNIVKVYKQQSIINGINEQLKHIQSTYGDIYRDMNNRLTEVYREMNDRFNAVYREMNDKFNEADRKIEEAYRDIHSTREDLVRSINDQITDAVTQCNSYTDKRIDKIIVNSSTRDAKQVLNETK